MFAKDFLCVALQQAMITFKEQDDEMEAWAPFEIFGEDVTMTSEDVAEIRRLSRECTVSVRLYLVLYLIIVSRIVRYLYAFKLC